MCRKKSTTFSTYFPNIKIMYTEVKLNFTSISTFKELGTKYSTVLTEHVYTPNLCKTPKNIQKVSFLMDIAPFQKSVLF